MTSSATPLVKAVISAKSLPSATIEGWNPGKVVGKKRVKGAGEELPAAGNFSADSEI
jgi:hypothetical protein